MSKILSLILGMSLIANTLTADESTLCQGEYLTPEQGQAMLQQRLAKISSLEDWESYGAHLRSCILKGAGLDPLPQRMPLNVITRNPRTLDGYTVTNVAIETVPGYFAGCNLYRPIDIKGPVPVVLCPNGHWGGSRFDGQVQLRCATLARMGAMAMSIGNFGWGLSPDQAVRGHVKPLALTMQLWNNMRALDYLLSLEDADPQRVAVTGASGGGTQTLLLTALDERVTVSVPVAMVSSYMYGGCMCESGLPIHRSNDHFTNNVEITALAAPRPLLLVSDGGDWTVNTPQVEYPFIQQIYQLYDAKDQVANVHFSDEGHDYGPNKREAMYRFLAEHLELDLNRILNNQGDIDESPILIEEIDTLRVFNDDNPFPDHICRSLEEIEASLKSLQQRSGLTVTIEGQVTPRLQFAADRLSKQLAEIPGQVQVILSSDKLEQVVDDHSPEGYRLYRDGIGVYHVQGWGDSGALYGVLELCERVTKLQQWPVTLEVSENPSFRLRGPCIGMQLTSKLPGRDTYEYPYTPENFPFFYDQQQWIDYLDFLLENRMNTLYLWNGHPFASLVKLEDYPYALEVSEEVYQRNVETFRLLTQEANKRGIWVIQMFYNIFVSQPFAQHHDIGTQHAVPNELLADYTRKSITKFVEMYPNVGLLVCLGEALRGQKNQEVWMNETVIPAVKTAMANLGQTEEPPIVVRAHAVSDVKGMVESAMEHYTNLYTMAKYNGESLTSYEPRGEWQQVHLDMSRLGSTHVVNVRSAQQPRTLPLRRPGLYPSLCVGLSRPPGGPGCAPLPPGLLGLAQHPGQDQSLSKTISA